MKRNKRYMNREVNIHRVCDAMPVGRAVTSTELSKEINLSRQAILEILKDAKTLGYVDCEKLPYRQHFKTVWTVKSWWLDNAHLHRNLVSNWDKVKQLELGI